MSEERLSRIRFRLRMLAACAVLVGLAMVQSPGLLVADTKFDLVVAPARFLARAAHLWDPQGAFGQLQNQAYGYLWPMGPFFLLGSLVDVPGWVTQRLWVALVMCVAFTGAAKVARALGVRSDVACLLGGFAYALSPRMLTTLGPISIEAWPSALAPWVLLPLVLGASAGSPRRAAALSAAAVAMVGGVNAAATFAVLPLGVVWLLTRTPGPRRRSLMLWWPAFTALGTVWWLVPLFVMGAYSPPFLDFIESASVTTFPTSLFDAARGTSDWVPYVDNGWRAGNDLITRFYLPLNSGVVLLLGFAGLMHRRNPHRQFLAVSLLVGLLMVTMGHVGEVHGWFAAQLHTLLDGSLAPLRNVHKFDPVVRLPLVVGLAWIVDSVGRVGIRAAAARAAPDKPTLERFVVPANRVAVTVLAVAVVAGAALPALAGRLTPSGPVLAVPGYWHQTARWLEDRAANGSALLVPGSQFADYVWGSPRDEPLQALAGSRWAVRNAIPLAPPGNIRMLDAIETRFAQGAGSAGLAGYLRRADVRYLVVRNDLVHADDVPDPVLVHEALRETPGVTLVRSFGPDVGGEANLRRDDSRVLVNGGWQSRYPAVEIFEVTAGSAPAVETDRTPVVIGGPEDLLDLADLRLIGQAPTRLAVDGIGSVDPAIPIVLTDGLRARERFFGRVHDGASATLTPGDVRRSGNPVRDYRLSDDDRWSTTVRLDGASAVSASSSMSDADALGGAVPGDLPFAAIDGSPSTDWVSGLGKNERAWWAVRFTEALEVGSVRLTGGAGSAEAQVARVRTARGTSRVVRLGSGQSRTLRLPPGPTTWLRVEEASGTDGTRLSLAEVAVPGVRVHRSLVLPRLPEGSRNPDAVVLRAARDARTGCVTIGPDVRCVAGRDRPSEEAREMRRLVWLPADASYRPSLTVVPRAGAALGSLLQRGQPFSATASSSAVADTRASALAAVDGDPGTTWVADASDLRPTLGLSWLGQRLVSGVALSVDQDTAARRPDRVVLVWPGGRREINLDGRGRARFPPIRTDRLSVRVDSAELASSLGFDRSVTPAPIGISELHLTGVPYFPARLPTTPVAYPCGTGPSVTVNGRSFRTSVTARPADLFAMKPAPAEPCDVEGIEDIEDMVFHAGENTVDVRGSGAFDASSLVLLGDGLTGATAQTRESGLASATPVRRVVRVGERAEVLSLRENFNPGWSATRDGRVLPPVVVDGWQQGFEVRGGEGAVAVAFGPDGAYRWGLGVGLLCLALLGAVVFLPLGRSSGRALPEATRRELGPGLSLAVGVLGAGLLAGWVGVLVAAAGGWLAVVLRRRLPEAVWWVLAGFTAVASVAYVVRPWGSASGWAGALAWPHYLVLVPLAGAFVLSSARSVEPPKRLRRIAGRSTSR